MLALLIYRHYITLGNQSNQSLTATVFRLPSLCRHTFLLVLLSQPIRVLLELLVVQGNIVTGDSQNFVFHFLRFL